MYWCSGFFYYFPPTGRVFYCLHLYLSFFVNYMQNKNWFGWRIAHKTSSNLAVGKPRKTSFWITGLTTAQLAVFSSSSQFTAKLTTCFFILSNKQNCQLAKLKINHLYRLPKLPIASLLVENALVIGAFFLRTAQEIEKQPKTGICDFDLLLWFSSKKREGELQALKVNLHP